MVDVDIDSIETFNISSWSIGRLFQNIETDELFTYDGIAVDPAIFLKLVTFGSLDKTNTLTFTLEIFENIICESHNGFHNMEKLLSLRPISIFPDHI